MKKSESVAYLMTASNMNEADIVETLLNMERIPVHREEVEAANYLKNYHGYSGYGVDLYVHNKNLEVVKNIMNAELIDEDIQGYSDDQFEGSRDMFCSTRRTVGKFIVWWAIVSHLSGFIIIVIQGVREILK